MGVNYNMSYSTGEWAIVSSEFTHSPFTIVSLSIKHYCCVNPGLPGELSLTYPTDAHRDYYLSVKICVFCEKLRYDTLRLR